MTKMNLAIAHQVPGRIRLKIPSAKDNSDLLIQIKETFGVIPGIENIDVNPVTGSVVLYYDKDRHDEFHGAFQENYAAAAPVAHHRPPNNEIDDLADKIEREAEFLAEHSHAARAVVDFFKEVDRQIKVASGNTIDLKIVLAVIIVGVTIFEVGASAATPVWVTLVIFGLNHFIEMHATGINPSMAAARA